MEQAARGRVVDEDTQVADILYAVALLRALAGSARGAGIEVAGALRLKRDLDGHVAGASVDDTAVAGHEVIVGTGDGGRQAEQSRGQARYYGGEYGLHRE